MVLAAHAARRRGAAALMFAAASSGARRRQAAAGAGAGRRYAAQCRAAAGCAEAQHSGAGGASVATTNIHTSHRRPFPVTPDVTTSLTPGCTAHAMFVARQWRLQAPPKVKMAVYRARVHHASSCHAMHAAPLKRTVATAPADEPAAQVLFVSPTPARIRRRTPRRAHQRRPHAARHG